MINAHIVDSGRLIANALPLVGDTINLHQFGEAVVKELYHNSRDNYIVIEWQGNKLTHRFEVALPSHNRNN